MADDQDQDQPKSEAEAEAERKPSSDFTFSFKDSDPDLAHLKESISTGKKAGNDEKLSELDDNPYPYDVNNTDSFNDSQSLGKIDENDEVDPSSEHGSSEGDDKLSDGNHETETEIETVTKDPGKLSWNSHVNKSEIGYPSGPVPEPEDSTEDIGFNETEFKDYLVSVGLYEIFELILLRLYQTPIRPEPDRVIEFILENLDSERQAEIKLRFTRTKEKLLDEIQKNEDLKKKNAELKKAVDEMISANYPNEPEQNLSWNEPEPAEDTSTKIEAQETSNRENDDEVTSKENSEENEVTSKESSTENDEVTKENSEENEVTSKEGSAENEFTSKEGSAENDEVTTKEGSDQENDQVDSAEPKIEGEDDEPVEEKENEVLQDDEELEHDAKDIISLLEHDLYDHEDEFKNEE